MTDEQNPQNSSQPSAMSPVQAPVSSLSFQDRLKQDISDLWARDRAFLFIFGVLILVVKFREVLISLLISSAKDMENQAEKKDNQLSAKENAANAQANQLVEQAKEEPTKEEPVTDDWYKKK